MKFFYLSLFLFISSLTIAETSTSEEISSSDERNHRIIIPKFGYSSITGSVLGVGYARALDENHVLGGYITSRRFPGSNYGVDYKYFFKNSQDDDWSVNVQLERRQGFTNSWFNLPDSTSSTVTAGYQWLFFNRFALFLGSGGSYNDVFGTSYGLDLDFAFLF